MERVHKPRRRVPSVLPRGNSGDHLTRDAPRPPLVSHPSRPRPCVPGGGAAGGGRAESGRGGGRRPGFAESRPHVGGGVGRGGEGREARSAPSPLAPAVSGPRQGVGGTPSEQAGDGGGGRERGAEPGGFLCQRGSRGSGVEARAGWTTELAASLSVGRALSL